MINYNVYDIDLNGKWSKIGPHTGFRSDAEADAYAASKAMDLWNNRFLYVVVRGELTAAHAGAGIQAALQAAEAVRCETDDDFGHSGMRLAA